jgi:hypothetical protein
MSFFSDRNFISIGKKKGKEKKLKIVKINNQKIH